MKPKPLLLLTLCAALAGCAGDPIMSHLPQDWMGHSYTQLTANLGEPTKIVAEDNGDKVIEYIKSGEFNADQAAHSRFRFGAGDFGGSISGGGGIDTTTTPAHLASYQNLWRFKIHGGKVAAWYAERREDGKVVWFDH